MRYIPFLLAVVSMAHAQSAPPVTPGPAAESAPLTTDDEQAIYALGLSIFRTLKQFDLSPEEVALVQRAISDSVAGKPAADLTEWAPKLPRFATAREARITERQKAASKAYLEKAAAEPGVERTSSGLIYREVTAGSGRSPKSNETVRVNYRGTLVDGTEFDSSYKRQKPAEFAVNGVIPCWAEGLQKMKAGGKSILVCPASLAYGDRAQPSIPGGSALIFEIELLEILGKRPAPPRPAR